MASLEEFFEEKVDKNEVRSLIKRRRAQMLIHSCIYYELDNSIISDNQWQEWADHLEELQTENPDCCKIGFFDFEFRDWTGATGNHLPLRDPWVISKARYIIDVDNKMKNK